MYPTWVLGLPTGQETGRFLTIDLGGTNLRVCWIILKGAHEKIEVKQQAYELPAGIKTARAEELWNLIAESLEKFINEHHLAEDGDSP
jgi:hexokinase